MDCKHSFIAYIDESGDDAINKHNDKNGSSHWFVLSAFIVRASRDIELPKIRTDILKQLGINRQDLHMNLIRKQDNKRYVAKCISEIPSRYISIISNKYSIIHSKRKDLYDEKNTYYNYMGRYLIERISWCCSKLRRGVPEGNGKVKIVFSKRGGMSYSHFREYLEKLKTEKDSNINWNVIDIDCIDAKAHSERAGLQIADVIAYSLFKSVELNKFEMIDTSFAQKLKNNTFNVNGKYIGYGIKIIPHIEDIPEKEKPTELLEIYK